MISYCKLADSQTCFGPIATWDGLWTKHANGLNDILGRATDMHSFSNNSRYIGNDRDYGKDQKWFQKHSMPQLTIIAAFA